MIHFTALYQDNRNQGKAQGV